MLVVELIKMEIDQLSTQFGNQDSMSLTIGIQSLSELRIHTVVMFC